jgi:hypothetical protein
MSSLKDKLSSFAEDLHEYVNIRFSLGRLKTAEKVSVLAGRLMAGMVLAFMAGIFLILVSIAGAIVVGKWLDNQWLGFLIVAAFYLLIGIIIWLARGPLIQLPVMNSIIHQLFAEDEEDQKHASTEK